jgi:hypothetical protein
MHFSQIGTVEVSISFSDSRSLRADSIQKGKTELKHVALEIHPHLQGS